MWCSRGAGSVGMARSLLVEFLLAGCSFVFFFQAEDGIRDLTVTGVQTCALPICLFPDALEQHRLRREIIATQLANSMVNRGGPSLLVRIGDQTGAPPARIAAAFATVRDSYGMTALNSAIDALDNKISGKLQLELYQAVEDLLLDRLVWFLRNVDLAQGLAAIVAHYREGIAAVEAALDTALPEAAVDARQGREADLRKQGVSHELARRLATLPALVAAPDIVMVAERTGQDIAEVAAIYFAAAAFFRLD